MTTFIQQVENIFNPNIKAAEAWANMEFQKVKAWAVGEVKVAEQFVATEAHDLVSGGINLLTAIRPMFLSQLLGAWKTVMGKLAAGTTIEDIEQAVLQELEHLGVEVVADVKALGSPGLQTLFSLFTALGLHL